MFLGLALLVSLICLVLGARRARVQEVLAFLILSSLVLTAYWAWWACLYSRGETEASKEVRTQLGSQSDYLDTLQISVGEQVLLCTTNFYVFLDTSWYFLIKTFLWKTI